MTDMFTCKVTQQHKQRLHLVLHLHLRPYHFFMSSPVLSVSMDTDCP